MPVRRSHSLRLVFVASALLMLLSSSYGTLAQGWVSPDPAQTPARDRAPARGVTVDLSTEPDAGVEALLARELEAATDRSPQVVIGDDGREHVADGSQPPYRSIALTFSVFGTGADEYAVQCTSTFVGPNVLITAAQCFYTIDDGMTNSVMVVPGVNGEHQPYPAEYATSVWVPQDWIDTEAALFDYALIVMGDDELGNLVGWQQIGQLSTETLSDPNFGAHTAGYPSDKPVDTMWESSASSFVQVDEYLLWHDMDTSAGQSGAPIMRASDHAIVGIHTGGNVEDGLAINRALRIEEVTLNDFLTACQDLGCSIAYFVEDETSPPPPPDPPLPPPADAGGDTTAFERTWSRTDFPVSSGEVGRTWMWGPHSFTGIIEEGYIDSPGGKRLVMYYDKSRMEISNPSGDPTSIWYITNGLLVVEMISGKLQLGNDTFEQHQAAHINVAGDGDDPNGVTYASFAGLLDEPALPAGSTIGQRVDRNGNVTQDPNVAAIGVPAGHFVPETNHTIAAPFWYFMNSEGMVWQFDQLMLDSLFENPYFATGYPITEAYWTTVRIGGTPLDVLVQCFERRCLTYNPSNPTEWQVEAGNVGLHYHQWRYELIPNEGEPAPPPPSPDNDGAPAEGEILAQANLSTWIEVSTGAGAYGEPGPESYFMTTPANSLIQHLAGAEVNDGSFSVDLRRVEPSSSGFGCLLIRADYDRDFPSEFNEAAYQYCLVYEGDKVVGLSLDYETLEEYVNIGFWDVPNGELPGDEWYQLKIIAEGGQFWLFLNEVYIGTATHNGATTGLIGVLAWNSATSSDDARYEFTNLVMRAIQ